MSDVAETKLQTRVHQQEVVAELGQQALNTDNIDQLLHDASVAVAETLDNDYCNTLELLPDGDEVFLRQGVGWREGLVGSATVTTDLDSLTGYTLLTEEPVVVDNLPTEDRFSGPELLTSHDVVSGISVIIGSVEYSWGVLGTYTTDRCDFTEDDATFVQSVANILAGAIKRREQKEWFQRLIEESSDMTFVVNNDGTLEYATPSVAEVVGYDPERIVGENALNRVHPEDVDELRETYADLIDDDDQTPSVEFRYQHADGSWTWLEARGHDLLDDSLIDGIVVYVRDVTERKEREQELERFKRAVEASGHSIYMTDPDGVITYVNPAFEEITGYSATEAVGENPRILQSGEHDDDYYQKLWETVRAGHVWEEEITDRRKDGSKYYAQQTIAPVTDESNDIDQFIAVQHDITERKEQQRALEVSERRYRTLVDHFPNGKVALFDHDLRYTAAGGELLDDLGVDEPVGQRIFERYPEEIVTEIKPHFETALDGEEREFELEYLGDRVLLARTLPVRSADSEVYGGMLVALDVTEERESKRRLEESHERLEEFASAVSHDLRKPLRTVASYLQILERRYEDELDEDAKEFINFAVGSATRMQDMIDGLVSEYARVDVEHDSFEPVELEAVFEDVLVDLETTIDESNTEITTDTLPCVEGDAAQLHQLFLNLLDNAIKYSGEEPPQIEISAERDGQKWVISVSDEGIGMNPEATEDVFDVFHRLHDDEYPGTGIGLALCHRIVERHGGEIWAESEPGEGSTFYITLPSVS